MDTRFFLLIIPLVGLIFGFLLRKIAPEEVAPGRRYFLLLQRTLLLLICLLLLWMSPFSLVSLLVFLVGFGLSFFLRVRFLYLGLVMLASLSMSLDIAFLITSLTLLYSLPFGTQMKTKDPVRAVIFHAVLYFLPFLLLLMPVTLPPFFLAFVAGTLFLRE